MTSDDMRELSLFTGAGGGVYASRLLGHRVVGYVELDDYCQRVIAQRIEDGVFDRAPIFGDIRAFVREGYASAYRGVAEVVSGGFPCQPHSVAGRGLGADDPRDQWPATRDVIGEVRPRYCFLENVPGLVASGYLGRVLGDLAALGYDAEWCVLGAHHVGAPHKRDRLWILAYLPDASDGGHRRVLQPQPERGRCQATDAGRDGKARPLADADRIDGHPRRLPERAAAEEPVASQRREELADAKRRRLEGRNVRFADQEAIVASENSGPRREWWGEDPADDRSPESRVGRVADGVADRRHRLEAIGNGQVPAVAVAAWRILMSRAEAKQ